MFPCRCLEGRSGFRGRALVEDAAKLLLSLAVAGKILVSYDGVVTEVAPQSRGLARWPRYSSWNLGDAPIVCEGGLPNRLCGGWCVVEKCCSRGDSGGFVSGDRASDVKVTGRFCGNFVGWLALNCALIN